MGRLGQVSLGASRRRDGLKAVLLTVRWNAHVPFFTTQPPYCGKHITDSTYLETPGRSDYVPIHTTSGRSVVYYYQRHIGA